MSVLASEVGRTPELRQADSLLISFINPAPRELPQLEARVPSQQDRPSQVGAPGCHPFLALLSQEKEVAVVWVLTAETSL